MKDYKQRFYNKMYSSEGVTPMEGFFYRHLKKFEDYREDVVYRLLPSGNKLLDVGCGDGTFVFKAKDKFEECYGVDISKHRIDRAQQRAKNSNLTSVYFRTCNVDESGLPYEDCSFDAITCIATLQHLFDPYLMFKEFSRTLVKGGTLIIEVPNIAYFPRRIELLFGKFPVTSRQSGWNGGTLHYFTTRSLSKLFNESRFKMAEKTGSGIFAGCRNWWPSLLTGDLIIKGIKIGQ